MNIRKNKKLKIFLFIIFLVILAVGVAGGVFTYLRKIDKRDNANSLVYLGVMEDGTYYAQDVPKDIRFQVDSEDTSLYKLINTNNEEVSSTIVKNNNKKFIQAESTYDEGETYVLELSEGINFTDKALKDARKLEFSITESEKANYEISDKVKTNVSSDDLQVEEKNGNKTVSIKNTDYKQDDILIIDNYPYKIESIEDETATLTRPDLSEIYTSLDLYQKGEINFDEVVANDEFKDQIEIGVKESDLYTFLESKVYAADDLKSSVTLIPDGDNLKIEIEINVAPEGEKFLGIQSLKEHGIKFKFSVELSSEYIADVELGKNIDMGVTTSQKISCGIEVYSKNKFFKGVSGLSDEEYAKTVQDIIEQLEQAEEDKASGKASLIKGIEVPTGIWGLNVYFDVYFQTSIAMQLNAEYNQTLEFKQVCGLSGDTDDIKPYSSNSVVNSSIEFEFQGKAETKVGLGIDAGLSFISKDFAQVGLGIEMGIYDGVYAIANVGVKTGESNSANAVANFRAEAGIYAEIKYSASIDFFIAKIAKEGSIVEARKPLLIAGTDEITTSIESSTSTIYVSNNKASVPTIYRNILNLNTKETRKEECTSNVGFTKTDGSKIEVTNGKLNLGSNNEKSIFAVYTETLGIYTIEIPLSAKKSTSTTSTSNTEFSSNASGSSVEDIYKNFLKTKQYREYTTKQDSWKKYNSTTKSFENLDVERYAMLDINKDGTPELLCEGNTDDTSSQWVDTLIVTYNKSTNQLILVADIYSYVSLGYNSVDKTVQHSSVRPNYYTTGVISYKMKNNQLKKYKMFSVDISGTEGGGGYDAVLEVKNYETGKETKYNSKEEVYDEMQKNVSEINYIDVSNL